MELQGTQAGTSGGSSTGAAGGASGQAQQVAEHAREVGQEALGQAKAVGEQAKAEAGAVASDVKDGVRQQLVSGQQRLAVALREFSDELDEVPQRSQGQLAKVAGQAAEATRSLSDWLEQREPRDLVRSVEDFARRRPMMFILISATAGAVVGRLTRGMLDGARESADGASAPAYPITTYPTTTPVGAPLDLRDPLAAPTTAPDPYAEDLGVGTTTPGTTGTSQRFTATAGYGTQGASQFPGIPDSEGLR